MCTFKNSLPFRNALDIDYYWHLHGYYTAKNRIWEFQRANKNHQNHVYHWTLATVIEECGIWLLQFHGNWSLFWIKWANLSNSFASISLESRLTERMRKRDWRIELIVSPLSCWHGWFLYDLLFITVSLCA